MQKCPTNWSRKAFLFHVCPFGKLDWLTTNTHFYMNDGSGPPCSLAIKSVSTTFGITLLSFNVYWIDRPASMVSHLPNSSTLPPLSRFVFYSQNRQTGGKTPADDVEGADSWDERKCGALNITGGFSRRRLG